jgi:hypothetical protein
MKSTAFWDVTPTFRSSAGHLLNAGFDSENEIGMPRWNIVWISYAHIENVSMNLILSGCARETEAFVRFEVPMVITFLW